MAGHSKWANIKHRKGAQDAKRSKIFAKISREIMVAASRGSDPSSNPALRLALSKARANSMPKKNIETAINKASGQSGGANYKNITYGGNIYGVSFLIVFLADNANRVASSIQAYFNRVNGTLSSASSVSYIFEHKGILEIAKNIAIDEETLMLASLEWGAEDFEVSENSYLIFTKAQDFNHVKENFEKNGYEDFLTAEISYVPNQEVKLPIEKANKIINFIDKLEEDDDVQAVFHNLDASSIE